MTLPVRLPLPSFIRRRCRPSRSFHVVVFGSSDKNTAILLLRLRLRLLLLAEHPYLDVLLLGPAASAVVVSCEHVRAIRRVRALAAATIVMVVATRGVRVRETVAIIIR